MLDEMTRRNASKFAIFYTYILKPKVAFPIFHFVLQYLFISLMNALVYVNVEKGIHQGKNKVAQNEKWEKQL